MLSRPYLAITCLLAGIAGAETYHHSEHIETNTLVDYGKRFESLRESLGFPNAMNLDSNIVSTNLKREEQLPRPLIALLSRTPNVPGSINSFLVALASATNPLALAPTNRVRLTDVPKEDIPSKTLEVVGASFPVPSIGSLPKVTNAAPPKAGQDIPMSPGSPDGPVPVPGSVGVSGEAPSTIVNTDRRDGSPASSLGANSGIPTLFATTSGIGGVATSNPVTTHRAILTNKDTTLKADISGLSVIPTLLRIGGPAITIGDQTFSLGPSGVVVMRGGKTTTMLRSEYSKSLDLTRMTTFLYTAGSQSLRTGSLGTSTEATVKLSKSIFTAARPLATFSKLPANATSGRGNKNGAKRCQGESHWALPFTFLFGYALLA